MTQTRRGVALFQVVGALLFGLAAVWATLRVSIVNLPFMAPLPMMRGIDPIVFERAHDGDSVGTAAKYDETERNALDKVFGVRTALYQSELRYDWCSWSATWVAMLLTAWIAMIVGARRAPGSHGSEADPREVQWLSRIGVLAAVASVLMAVSGGFRLLSEEMRGRGQEVSKLIVEGRMAFARTQDHEGAQRVIDDLTAKTAKYK